MEWMECMGVASGCGEQEAGVAYGSGWNQVRASNGSHMKAAHNVLYMKKHTQTYASYPAMDISCMTSRSVVYISK